MEPTVSTIAGLRVLSLFDGISCTRQALKDLGISVSRYYASEIDKPAIDIAKHQHPDIVHLGDVTKIKADDVGEIDLLIGGSPCQDLSQAKNNRQGLAGARSGLFYEYVRILQEVKPKYFVYENVASMAKDAKDTITQELGVEPVLIDAGQISAQKRKRLFWTNFPVKLPEPKPLKVSDIVDPNATRRWLDIPLASRIPTSYGCKYDVSGKGYSSQQDRAYKFDAQFPTIPKARTETKMNILFPDGRIGVITRAEVEKAQGLPIGYTNSVKSKEKSYGGIGNGFSIPAIKHVLGSKFSAKNVVEALLA